MCAGPDGKVAISRICTGQRKGYDICPASPVGREILKEAYMPLFESGVDYSQILDQNHGGGQYFCYSAEHGHAPAPGPWMTEEMVKLGLIDSTDVVIDTHMERVKKAYPAYFDTYEHIDDVVAYLNTVPNLYCVGRNGQHRYNNLDHSMCTSFEAVKAILSGSSDRSAVWNVNTEKEYHESKSEEKGEEAKA